MNDKRHTWSQWRYGHSTLAVDGKLDTNLPNCAIMDNYYVDKPLWRVDLGSKVTVNGAVILTWQGAGQGMLLHEPLLVWFRFYQFSNRFCSLKPVKHEMQLEGGRCFYVHNYSIVVFQIVGNIVEIREFFYHSDFT